MFARKTGRAVRRHPSQGGFSLIELMISIVIGFAVIGALLVAYQASVQSGRNNQAVNQMSEDASTALNVMRTQLAMAGYSYPTTISNGKFVHQFSGTRQYLFGCNGGTGFADSSLVLDSLTCAGAPGAGPDTLALAYEIHVDVAGTKAYANGAVASTKQPYDCIGNLLTTSPYIADSHFYLATPAGSSTKALYCRQGGAAAAGQPLAENIVDLQVKYLTAVKTAQQVDSFSDSPSATPSGSWRSVYGVRLCVEVVSTSKMTDANANYAYVDCSDTQKFSTDGRLHRSFTTTVLLQK
jgi:type IV pilus assembly protein PilW